MPQYLALTHTADVDWSHPDQAAAMAEYSEFGAAATAVIRGGAVLYPTATATTVRVSGKGGEVVNSDGPYAETKEALTGFYLLESAPTWTRHWRAPRRFRRPGPVRSRFVRSFRWDHEWDAPPPTCSVP